MRRTDLLLVIIFLLAGCAREMPQLLHQVPTLTVRQGITSGFDLSVYKKAPATRVAVTGHPDLDIRYVAAVDSLYIRPLDSATGLLTVPFTADGLPYSLMVKVKKMIRHTFTWQRQPGDTLVVVMGAFNDWSRTALPLTDVDGDSVLERAVYLRPERHEYKFVVNRQEVIDPANPIYISNNIGGWNSILDLSDQRTRSGGRFVKKTTHGSRLEYSYQPEEDGALPMLIQVLVDNTTLTDMEYDPQPDGSLIVNTSGWDNGLVRILGLDAEQRLIAENHTIIKNGRPLAVENEPDDWHFATIYSVMVDRFNDGDPANNAPVGTPELHPLADFNGGDLAGITAKINEGYFDDLGISTLWIFPVNRQPQGAYVESIPPHRSFTGYHGYWPVHPREIDPRFGTAEYFTELVQAAHGRGMKVLLDFVSNHVHEDHIYNQQHPEWFGSMYLPDGTVNIRNWSEETRLTTWFDEFIPSFDFPAAPAAIDQVVDDAIWWLETFDLDGFRQDAVKHVPHKFWRQLTATMKQRFPEKDFYQIGESFGSDELIASYVNPGELNSQFNFAIYFNARGPFSADEADFSHLGTIMADNPEVFGPVNLMGNITSSHDQGRFMGFADGQVSFSENGTERAFNNPPTAVTQASSYGKMANFTAFNMTIPGVPVIYYGEEIGLMGAADPDNRRPMYFGDQLSEAEKELLELTGRLTKLRRKYSALAIGDHIPIQSGGPVLAYGRAYFDELIVVVINQSPAQREVELWVSVSATVGQDLLSGDEINLDGNSLKLELQPYDRQIIKID